MKKLIVLILSLFLLTGCSEKKVIDSYIYIDIPSIVFKDYLWECEISNDQVILYKSQEYISHGNTFNQKYILEAVDSGEATITFKYLSNSTLELLYTLQYAVRVDDNLDVHVISSSGDFNYDIPKLTFEKKEFNAYKYFLY